MSFELVREVWIHLFLTLHLGTSKLPAVLALALSNTIAHSGIDSMSFLFSAFWLMLRSQLFVSDSLCLDIALLMSVTF